MLFRSYEFYINSADYVKERLDSGLLDFGLLLEPVDIAKYDYIRLQEKEIYGVFMRADHPLTAKESLGPEDLLGIPLITAGRLSQQKEIENWFGDTFPRLNIFGKNNLITSNIAMLVQDNVACALTVEGAVRLFDPNLFAFRPLSPELSMGCVLAWKKFQPSSNAAGKFLEHFKSYVLSIQNHKI